MALNYDYLTSLTQKKYIPKLADNIFEQSAFLAMAKADGRVLDGGTKIVQPLLYGKSGASGTFGAYDSLDITPNEKITAAEMDYGFYYASVTISKQDEVKNRGTNAILRLLEARMQSAEMELKETVGQALYQGSGNNAIIGLDTAIGTGSYAGIDGSTYTWWQSYVDTTAHARANMVNQSTDSYILKLLQTGFKKTRHLSRTANLILTTQDIFDILEEVLQQQARYQKGTITKRGQLMADGGFQVLEWRGIPLVVDDLIDDAADPMYMLNTEFYSFYVSPEMNFRFTGFKEAQNSAVRAGQIFLAAQQILSNRRMFARWSDLNN